MANQPSKKTNPIEWETWRKMRSRCRDPKEKLYHGMGVRVCARWEGPSGFVNFLTDMGPRPGSNYSIDRYPNNNGNYEPSNCRWATSIQQQQNLRNNYLITWKDETYCMSEWSRRLGMRSPQVLWGRLQRHDLEKALFGAIKPYKRLLTHDGVTLSLSDWARRLGVGLAALSWRIRHQGVDSALSSQPVALSGSGGRLVSYSGETKPIREWAKLLGIDCKKILDRSRKRLGDNEAVAFFVEKLSRKNDAPSNNLS